MKCSKCQAENPETKQFCADCGTQLIPQSKDVHPGATETLQAPIHELTTGDTFAGRYQIIEELGKGGMGKVYKVYDTKIKEKVALKLIKPGIASDRETIERFSNELRLARKIAQRNVCKMFDLGDSQGAHFITMEYVHGEDLKSMIQMTGSLNVGAVLSIGKQICDGLAEAHSLGVVHRDLKPQNIMIDKGGNAKIMDFGIARFLREKGITGASMMIGTPEYMSPEQAEAKEVDQRSDIYSLGIILYEMATGHVPFEGETALSIAMKHKGEAPKNPKQLNPNIPDDLSSVILRCLEKEKTKRYQSTGEVHADLEKIEKGIPTTERLIPKRKPFTSKQISVTFRLKRLVVPTLILIVAAIIGVILWNFLFNDRGGLSPKTKRSIAVLPFEDLSPQKDQGYFCEGLADELINRLTNVENLRVPARTSAFSFKEKNLDVREIGKRLNVETILEGSIRKADKKIRITVQLINVVDGYPIWSEQFDKELTDIFLIQDEISLAIAEKLKINLLGGLKEKFVKHDTEDVEAYNFYLKGRFYWSKRTEEDVKKGIDNFQQAIEKDPSYAAAYAGLADCYNAFGWYRVLPPKEAFSRAKATALKALEIDKTLAEAHASLAYAKFYYDWDWPGAEKEFRLSSELNATYPTTPHWHAEYLAAMGRVDEAIAEKERASKLDPLSMVINSTIGWMSYFARKYDQAIEQIKKASEIDPNFAPAHYWLGQAYLQKGKFKEAITEFKNAANLSKGSLYVVAGLAHAYAVSGEKVEAQKMLDQLIELSTKRYVSPYDIAEVCIGLGKQDLALDWLQKALDDRSHALVFLNVEPKVDSLRSDPRFKALLKKMNLE